MKKLPITLVAAVALSLPSAALASVKLVHVTSPAYPGEHATLAVKTSRPAICSITVNYKSGPSHAQGLYPKHTARGRVSWTWFVGTNTTAGRWGIVVYCGRAGTLRTSFVVG